MSGQPLYLRLPGGKPERQRSGVSQKRERRAPGESKERVSHLVFLGEKTGGLERGALATAGHLCHSGVGLGPQVQEEAS